MLFMVFGHEQDDRYYQVFLEKSLQLESMSKWHITCSVNFGLTYLIGYILVKLWALWTN